jgi:hypothetical protein
MRQLRCSPERPFCLPRQNTVQLLPPQTSAGIARLDLGQETFCQIGAIGFGRSTGHHRRRIFEQIFQNPKIARCGGYTLSRPPPKRSANCSISQACLPDFDFANSSAQVASNWGPRRLFRSWAENICAAGPLGQIRRSRLACQRGLRSGGEQAKMPLKSPT